MYITFYWHCSISNGVVKTSVTKASKSSVWDCTLRRSSSSWTPCIWKLWAAQFVQTARKCTDKVSLRWTEPYKSRKFKEKGSLRNTTSRRSFPHGELLFRIPCAWKNGLRAKIHYLFLRWFFSFTTPSDQNTNWQECLLHRLGLVPLSFGNKSKQF